MKHFCKGLSKRSVCGVTASVMSLVVAATGFYALKTPAANADVYKVTETREQLAEASTALNVQIMEEGMVLLKNNGALPLASGAKIDLLGVGSYNTLWGETGGGNGKKDYTYLKDSLESAGFSVTAYDYSSVKSVTLAGASVYLEPELSTIGTIASGNVAVITISRSGKESNDNLVVGASMLASNGWEEGTHQLQLNINEKALIAEAKSKADKVIILLNTPASMQIPELESDDDIDAIMYIGMPGQYGLQAVGNVLSGKANPSGRTVATWAADFTKDPTYANFGANTGSIGGIDTLEYEEGIYVGYKYYETAAAEEYIDYDAAVVYPFGYGLSYSTFEQKLVTTSVDLSGKAFDDYIEIEVKVSNTSETPGKEVVQIYNHAPYTEGGIEKSEVTLVGFAKTGVVTKGTPVTVKVPVRVGDLASFDWNDANENNWYGYEIEAGDYELRLQSNSHTSIDELKFSVANTIAFNNDGTLATITDTENKDNLVFSTGDDFDSLYLASEQNGGDFKIMSRADFENTFPTAPEGNNTYDNTINTKYAEAFTPDMDKETDPWYVSAEEIPSTWTQGANTSYTLADMIGIDYTSDEKLTSGAFSGKTGEEAWVEFMNQLTWDEIISIPAKGSHLTVAVPSIGKPQQADSDGPEQLGDGTFWACANIIAGTWNVELCKERGIALANEALYAGYTGWYGPTANINRSPFGGRNNIYFSEDSLLAGKISAANIAGAQSRGVIAYVKHYALNEQETNRTALATFATEQALRETYLKAFEYTVKEGGALGMMQAMNRVGGVNCYGNYALDQVVLRDEWGFLGGVVTDSYNQALARENMLQRMGGDFPLGSFPVAFAGTWDSSKNTVTYNGTASPTQWSVIRNSAMHVLYMAANSNQMLNGYNITAVATKDLNVTVTAKAEIEEIDASVDFGTDVIYSATGLPAGLSIDAKTGKITGTPTEAGEYDVTVTLQVTAEGESWISASYTGKITVEGAGLSTGALVGIIVGVVAVIVIAGVVVLLVLKKKKNGAAPVAEAAAPAADTATETDTTDTDTAADTETAAPAADTAENEPSDKE